MDWPGENVHEAGTENNKLKNCLYTLIHFCLKLGFSNWAWLTLGPDHSLVWVCMGGLHPLDARGSLPSLQ